MQKNSIAITIMVALVVGAGAFFGGIKYQQSQRQNIANGQFFRSQNGQQLQARSNNQGARPVSGEIISTDDKSITVKLTDGSSKIIILSDKTIINKASEGSAEDLKEGEQVAIFGQQNSDGSVTAQSVQLNPQVRTFQREQGGTPTQQ